MPDKLNLESIAKTLSVNIDELTVVGEGMNGLILTDGSGLAFKFPKSEVARKSLERETKIISLIRKHISFPIPQFKDIFLDEELGKAYVSFTLINGVKLTNDIYNKHQHTLLKQIKKLLSEIHSMPVIDLFYGNVLNIEEMYFEIQDLLYPFLSEDKKLLITTRFEKQLSMAAEGVSETVIHGDLGGANILVDERTGEITGVIDWAELTIGNSAYDYSSLTCYASVPKLKEDLLIDKPNLINIFKQAEFIQFTFPILEALYGAKTGNKIALYEGLSGIIG